MEIIGKIEEIIPELFKLDRDKIYRVNFKEYKKKRSLNANSYVWSLINEIANVLRLSKEDVYLQLLKQYGQSVTLSILSKIDVTGYFKYYDVIGTSKLNGKEFTHYKYYKGTSEYDTREMAIFIDGVVHEADNLGIPTITDKELERLKCD